MGVLGKIGLLLLPAVVFLSINSYAADGMAPQPVAVKPPAPPAYPLPSIEKLGNGEFRIGEIVINKATRSVSFPAQVNMDKGLLEYLLVYRTGKTHESLLRTDISAYNLQIAFMLLGFEGTDKPIAGQGAKETPRGEAVTVALQTASGESFAVEKWLINKTGETVTDIERMNWVFAGSYVYQGVFMAQSTGSMIAIWHDPVAMIDNASPGGESNRIWYVKQGTVPTVGTPVRVVIKSAKPSN